ncbi:transmembrane protein 268 isoform X4 [Prinia subflava]|uniref:transmembrane protein 268 isoform X4 n=1 Tax=Prinia subflava TaxID=208062 RepID=UPI002FE12726
MAQKNQTGGTENNESSLLYCKSDFKEGALQWVTEPPQGRVLLVLRMDNTCPSSSFDMDLCAQKLQSLGVQVPMDPCRRLLQEGLLRPPVRRYLFYSSRGFQMAMAGVFYISLWTNLYCTLQLCSLGHSWGTGVLVTLVALALTVLVILVIDCHQRKAGLRHRLNKLCVVMDVAVQPELGMEEEAPREESPLLSSGGTLNKDAVTCSELLHLIPEGPPEAVAQQLLVIFSGCYVRLLVTGRLPGAGAGGHLGHSSVPCPCQFIQSTLLHAHHSWGG